MFQNELFILVLSIGVIEKSQAFRKTGLFINERSEVYESTMVCGQDPGNPALDRRQNDL